MLVNISVSLGELVDKISILMIKQKNVVDSWGGFDIFDPNFFKMTKN